MKGDRLDRAVEIVLTVGLAAGALLLLAGSLAGRPEPLRWGIVALMLTPVARVVVVTIGMFAAARRRSSASSPSGSWWCWPRASASRSTADGARGRCARVLYDWDGTLGRLGGGQLPLLRARVRGSRDRVRPRALRGHLLSQLVRDVPGASACRRTVGQRPTPDGCEEYAREECRLLPGVAEALVHRRDAGLRQGLVTSGSRERVARDVVAGGRPGSSARRMRRGRRRAQAASRGAPPGALDASACDAAEAAYVGDSPEDVAMARAAGVFSVGIPGGFPNRGALRPRPVRTCWSSPSARPSALSSKGGIWYG